MGEWRLIQYAEKSCGNRIIAYDASLDMVGEAFWGNEMYDDGMKPAWYWAWHDRTKPIQDSDCNPEFWMPLPKPPEGYR